MIFGFVGFCVPHPIIIQIKNVDKLLNMEPSNNNISQMYIAENLCTELVLLMKQSTQEYYNMRITLGLECI